MANDLTRRRFLSISACMIALPHAATASVPVAYWRGVTMGAGASVKLVGVSQADAAPVFAAMEAELSRLEDIFSLYRIQSALSRLNHDGHLDAPPPEMLELLGRADAIHRSTDGAFDPTVQPLWSLYAEAAQGGQMPERAAIARILNQTGWKHVRFGPQQVSFARPGMALTLNGIAQGYVTDRIAALLRDQGFGNVLVDMGETRALGQRGDGGEWQIGIARPDGTLERRIGLSDRALATSAPMGTVLDPAATVGHIVDPRDGSMARAHSLVSVSAGSATLADGLSTAFCVMDRADIELALASWPDARLEVLIAS